MAFALEGIKVVDLSQVAAAPMAARHLADFGADVIHVENPGRGDSWRAIGRGITGGIQSKVDFRWENFNRNKKAMTLNLTQERGQEVMYKLVESSDVFLTNMRPFQLEEWKIDYDTLSRLNPKIVYGHLAGYGKEGPDKDLPSTETTAFYARGGVAQISKEPEGYPLKPPLASEDNVGALALALGIMIALYAREKTGIGQEVDVSLFQTAIYAISNDIAGTLVTGEEQQLTPRIEEKLAPANFWKTKDGRWIRTVVSDNYYPNFCRAIGRTDLIDDPRFKAFDARRQNQAIMFDIIEEIFGSKTLDEWRVLLDQEGVNWGLVQTLPEVCADPMARANNMFVPFEHPTYGKMEVVANPITLTKTPASVRSAAPEFSQNTEEILLELGYTWEDIIQFKEQQIIV